MTGPLVIVLSLACASGLCAFLIDYYESLHHLSKRQAVRHGVTTALAAVAFFVALGIGLFVFLL